MDMAMILPCDEVESIIANDSLCQQRQPKSSIPKLGLGMPITACHLVSTHLGTLIKGFVFPRMRGNNPRGEL